MKKKIKIAYVIDQLGMGGAERVCINLAQLFHENGFDVKLIVFDLKGELFDLLIPGLNVSILEKALNGFSTYKKLVEQLEDIDIVHVHMRQNYKFVKRALFYHNKRKQVILHDHYGKIAHNKKAPIFYKILFRPNYYIGCSSALTEWAKNKLKLKSEQIFLVSNFVLKDHSKFKVFQPEGLVLVGNLKAVKNHKLAINLAKELGKNLTIYCRDLEGDYYKELTNYMDSENYSKHVNFITGCTNVQSQLKKYELGLLTSTSEGDPLVLIEYLAQGLPFLCSDVGESVKIIKKYFPSFVQEDFEVKKWVSKYNSAVSVPREAIEKLYEEHFSETCYLNKYKVIYEKICGVEIY